MKLTKTKLKQLIKEELDRAAGLLQEVYENQARKEFGKWTYKLEKQMRAAGFRVISGGGGDQFGRGSFDLHCIKRFEDASETIIKIQMPYPHAVRPDLDYSGSRTTGPGVETVPFEDYDPFEKVPD